MSNDVCYVIVLTLPSFCYLKRKKLSNVKSYLSSVKYLCLWFAFLCLAEAIPSGGIKSEIGSCHKKKGPNGLNQEFCYINNKQYSEVEEYFKNEQEKSGKGCRKFKLSDFNEKSPSIMYGEASGRFGNQLLGYATLYQIG